MEAKCDRREFIELVGLGSAGLYLSPLVFTSCQNNDLLVPFDVWNEMITALEQSPDHLPGRRKALVAAKDPKAMIQFVRDGLQMIPEIGQFLHQANRLSIYGTDAALRCGLATPREKAEILKEMLSEAGFEAKVVLEETEITEEEVKNIVFRENHAVFAPPISKKQLKKWKRLLGANDSNGSVDQLLDLDEKCTHLADGLISNLNEKHYSAIKPNSFRFHKSEVPSVVYVLNGKEHYAHVFDPNVTVGQLHPSNKGNTFKDAPKISEVREEDIKISLTYRTAIDYWEEKELLSGTWKLSELIGSTMQILFMKNMDFAQQATKSISDISTFTPCFAYQKFDQDLSYMEERSLVGEPITLEGKEILKNVVVKENNGAFGDVSQVKTFEIKATPMAFPKVKLELYPKDGSGTIVEGLSAANFKITDNGKAVTGWLEQNVFSPKIMLLYDTSLSMPQEYRGDGAKEFAASLEEMVKEMYPNASVRSKATTSNVYTSLLKAKQSSADLILYATDGHNDDQFQTEYKDVYETGPPAILLNVFNVDTFYKHLRENFEFKEIPADDQLKTKEEIRNIISQMSFPPYVLTYHSFEEENEHRINVSIKEKELSDEATIVFPKPNDLYLGERIIGLYVEISWRSNRIKRTLAGWDNYLDRDRLTPSRKYIEDVHEMMLGGAMLAFEREAPTLSVRLTEYLCSLVSNKEWFMAQQMNDTKKAVEALEKGTLGYPPLLLTMMQPLNHHVTEKSVTYPTQFRSCLLRMKPGYYKDSTKILFDYLPTAKYASMSRSGTKRENLYETVKKTAQFAFLEEMEFDDSAVRQLQGHDLVSLHNIRNEPEYGYNILKNKHKVFQNRIFRENQLSFFDKEMNVPSYFEVDRNSGELRGILPDGSGGGSSSTAEQLKALKNVIDEYQKVLAGIQLMMMIPGAATSAAPIVALYSMTLVKLYAFATEAIIVMNPDKLEGQVSMALKELACNVYKSIIMTFIGKMGRGEAQGVINGMDGLENLIAMMGGNFSFLPCPSA
ncbi:hypothetical protein D2V93_02115 [Flagellimonas taeanensis]|uniref:hypothetical protein n=1 Tax=Flavobacteriaceae TaxID=49546 RepID=UPI000E6916F8|nr:MULTISPECIES: hypothetical protein [Allomuricauda]MDC6384652.1 hypothetical protein [Muricauda sp. SK9]RIV53600.1 hypothetical protein D2V93_02115 [Allomuricauda taeanensis]